MGRGVAAPAAGGGDLGDLGASLPRSPPRLAPPARALVAAQQLPWAGESVKVRFVDGRYEYVGADAQPAALARDAVEAQRRAATSLARRLYSCL